MNQNPEDLRAAGLHRGPNQVDYRETADLTGVHAAVQREHSEGTPGQVPMPLWLMVLCGVAIFWAGTSFSGGFGASYFGADNYSVHPGEAVFTRSTGSGGGGGGGGAAQGPSIVDQGKIYFGQNCAQCHQITGMGTPNIYPPLAGSGDRGRPHLQRRDAAVGKDNAGQENRRHPDLRPPGLWQSRRSHHARADCRCSQRICRPPGFLDRNRPESRSARC